MDKRIGFGKRFAALILDTVIVLVLSFALGPFIGGLMGGAAGSAAGGVENTLLGGMVGAMAAISLIIVIYFLIEGFTGVTVGKMILGIKIGTADGGPGSVGVYLTRYLIKNIGSIVALVAGFVGVEILGTIGSVLSLVFFLGCFLVLLKNKQALHDILGKTAVYRRSDLQ